jgi:tetratricopeptide (TPR) repeat protein
VQARFNQGLALHQQGRLADARECYQQVLKLRPGHFDALHLSGVIALQTQHFALAVELIGKAIALDPRQAAAYNNLGNALDSLNQPQAALESFDKAIRLKPDYPEACCNRGLVLVKLAQLHAAIESFDKAIALKTDYAEAWFNRGHALHLLHQPQAAVDSYRIAIQFKGDYAIAYNNCGNALRDLKELQAAVDSYDKAVAIKADYAEAHYNRGSALGDMGQHRAAVESFDKAVAIKADHVQAHYNRGNALGKLKQHEEAFQSFERAIALHADHADAHFNQSMYLLESGNFALGWEKYEWRWKDEFLKSSLPGFTQPLWLGAEPLQGKTILLHAEQGFGDTLQFCRYARRVSALGARVILEVPPSLMLLLAGLEGVSELVAKGSPLPAFDYHCPLLSLPLAFKTDLDSIPAANSYLSVPAAKRSEWTARLGKKTRPRVGLVWSGSTVHKNDKNRSFLLSDFVKGLPDGFQYISLQKEVRDADRTTLALHPDLLHFGEAINDFSDTAALCELVDVVVSVDTSVAHLAGALGRPVWIVLPFNADWRWLLDRNDSPWYPTVTLYRQQALGDWGEVFKSLAADLRRLAVPADAT